MRTSKGKDKKQQRKEELERLKQVKATVDAAAKVADALEAFPAFRSYDRHGLAAQLSYHHAAALPPQLIDWALGLCKSNMQEVYEAGGWKWKQRSKLAELADPDTRFLLVSMPPPRQQRQQQEDAQDQAAPVPQDAGQGPGAGSSGSDTHQPLGAAAVPAAPQPGAGVGAAAVQAQQDGQAQGDQPETPNAEAAAGADTDLAEAVPVAYVSLRYEVEAGEAVLYVYEVQLEEAVQRKGLGRCLMQLCELIAHRLGMRCIRLTVMHGNEGARKLYASLGYTLDESTPTSCDPSSDAQYDILCKRMRQRAAAAAAVQGGGAAASNAARAKAVLQEQAPNVAVA